MKYYKQNIFYIIWDLHSAQKSRYFVPKLKNRKNE